MNPHTGLVHVRYWPAPAIGAGDVIDTRGRSRAAGVPATTATTGAGLRRVGIREIAGAVAVRAYHRGSSGKSTTVNHFDGLTRRLIPRLRVSGAGQG